MCNHKKYSHKHYQNLSNVDKRTLKIYRLRGFFIHLLTYLLVNTGLIVINLLTAPSYYWFVWPLMGWGIGLVSDALATPGLRWVLRGGSKPTFLEE